MKPISVPSEFPQKLAASAAIAQPFTLYVIVLNGWVPPTEAQWNQADPILHILPRGLTLMLVPALAIILVVVLWRHNTPTAEHVREARLHAALGFLGAGFVAVLLRMAVGDTLPDFIPPEESAKPGYLLSMTAGYAEELLFRLLLLPALVLALVETRLSDLWAMVVGVIITSAAFVLLHEAGSSEPAEMGFILTRFFIPGVVMSIAFLISPAFLITAHSAAHIFIPALFV